jgi:hypothetical protein
MLIILKYIFNMSKASIFQLEPALQISPFITLAGLVEMPKIYEGKVIYTL